MAKKKESLITEELDWYETELKEAREYLTNIKLDKLSDRPVKKGTANGGVTEVMVTKEEIAEHKFRLLAALPKLINSVKELREKEAEKIELRKGFDEIEGIMNT